MKILYSSVFLTAVMEELVEDDICILNHEKADNAHKRDGEIPVSSYSGDESVASHFALVTAYEDIKKRLKETEKENSLLKKRVRILEEKVRKKSIYQVLVAATFLLLSGWQSRWLSI